MLWHFLHFLAHRRDIESSFIVPETSLRQSFNAFRARRRGFVLHIRSRRELGSFRAREARTSEGRFGQVWAHLGRSETSRGRSAAEPRIRGAVKRIRAAREDSDPGLRFASNPACRD
jgi:hypothetical protein